MYIYVDMLYIHMYNRYSMIFSTIWSSFQHCPSSLLWMIPSHALVVQDRAPVC